MQQGKQGLRERRWFGQYHILFGIKVKCKLIPSLEHSLFTEPSNLFRFNLFTPHPPSLYLNLSWPPLPWVWGNLNILSLSLSLSHYLYWPTPYMVRIWSNVSHIGKRRFPKLRISSYHIQSQATCRKNTKINITTSNPLQPNIYSHHLHNVLAEATRQPAPPNPHLYLVSPLGWMRFCNKMWSKNKLLIYPPTKPVWPQSSLGAQAPNLTPFVSPTRMEAPKRQEFLSIIIHSAPSLTHGRSSILVDLIHFSHSIIILLDSLGDTSDTSSGKWVNTSKANGEIWVRELCLIDHSFGTNC